MLSRENRLERQEKIGECSDPPTLLREKERGRRERRRGRRREREVSGVTNHLVLHGWLTAQGCGSRFAESDKEHESVANWLS